jgi:hypothetical protein
MRTLLSALRRLRYRDQPQAPDPAVGRVEGLLSEIAGHLAALREETRAPDPAVGRAEGLLSEIAGHLAALREETRAADPAVGRIEGLLSEGAGHLATLRWWGTRLETNNLSNFLLAHLTAVAVDNDPKSLRRHYGQVYSQNGEDGIIAEIFRRIGGPQSRVFIEIGIENGLQNNTRFLLEQGWSGLWIEGSAASAQAAAGTFARYIEAGQLQVVDRVTTPENVNEIIAGADLPGEIDFVSVDIDQHTHFVWEALTKKARVHCIEYNGSIPPSLDLWVPYDPTVAWDGSNFFGAGLKTMERIGRLKGLNLVGCDLIGINAFFVDAAVCGDRFQQPFTAEVHYELPKYGSLQAIGHRPSPGARHWSG